LAVEEDTLMAKRAKDTIPHDILEAAEAAGIGTPLWYVGRTNGHDPKPGDLSAGDLMRQARHDAGQPQPPAIDPKSKR
jgi:hypothetical protein